MKRPAQLKIKEKWIESQILHYLGLKGIFAWKAKTVGTYDPTKKVFRKNAGYMKGVADILGIWRGKLLAIEVKTPTGKLSPEQKQFLSRVQEEGGIAFVARSVEDVKSWIERKPS
jgi:penicillin-binding protein-related factor A (putative recombinase)